LEALRWKNIQMGNNDLPGEGEEPGDPLDIVRLQAMVGSDGVVGVEELCCVVDAAGFVQVKFLADVAGLDNVE
jgi:hypothetical protein